MLKKIGDIWNHFEAERNSFKRIEERTPHVLYKLKMYRKLVTVTMRLIKN